MPRASKPKAVAQAEAQAPVPVPVATPAAPAPVQEQDTRSPLHRVTGSDERALQNTLVSDAVASLGLPQDHPHHAERLRSVVGLMSALEPRDGVEGALAASFAALHANALQLLRRAANANLPPDVASRLRRDAVALLRTANETVAAVQEHRGRTTHQRVVVERVIVQEGGKAVVGAVANGGAHGR